MIFLSRKNFDYENRNKFLKILFSFRITYKIIYIFAKSLDFIREDNPFSRKLYHYLYFFQPIRKISKSFLSDKDVFHIDYGFETREATIASTNEELNFSIKNLQFDKINFGIGFIEQNLLKNKELINSDVNISIEIIKKNKVKKYEFQIPFSKKKHGIVKNKIGSKWFDFFVNLDEFKNHDITIKLIIRVNKKTFLVLDNSGNNEFLNRNLNLFSISGPRLQIKNSQKKKIIIFSMESLTEINFLENLKKQELDLKNLKDFSFKNKSFHNAFTFCDATLPNVLSMQTGLSPSQHGIADHKCPLYKETANPNLEFLAEKLSKKDFFCQAFLAGPRFDTLKYWNLGYHSVINAPTPYNNDSPNFYQLEKFIEDKIDENIFVYFHFYRLHAPFLNLNKIETPFSNDVSNLNEAYSSRNFYPIYFSQLKRLDYEFGKFINFLKSKKLYDDTLIVLTGDHGNSLPPNWKHSTGDSLYREHINVPLIFKKADWDNNTDKIDDKKYVSSHYSIFNYLLDSLRIEKPNYFETLPQENLKKLNFALSETIHFPKNSDYKFMLSGDKTNILTECKIDWTKNKILNIEKKITNDFNNANEIDIGALVEDIAIKNLEFRQKYGSINFKDTIKKLI